jgi:hypothetical protein
VSPRERLKDAAWRLGFEAVFALHPGLWKWAHKEQRKARQRPVWQHVARTVAAGVLLGAVAIYFERERERLKVEQPELFE